MAFDIYVDRLRLPLQALSNLIRSLAERALLLQHVKCSNKCDYRCSKAHHRKACLLYCNICCQKCLCVPSGTYGHKDECPCYNNWKTKGGKPKCP
ncbi:putative gibberellin regulated protein [Dioscorea sansibarensis]